jgi:sulfite reductase (ferredoxin)
MAKMESKTTGEGATSENTDNMAFRDYRGVVCPMNFVKVKVDLSKMSKGELLNVLLDDGQPIQDVPRSASQQGHDVVEKKKEGDHWSLTIRKG